MRCDDELSISRYSKYCTHFVNVARLRDERAIVEILLGAADRLGLSGWVLYPTREELVAAISRNRDQLSKTFRVPTPEWNSVQWAWDKRNTYQLARQLGIPTPRSFYPENVDALDELKCVDPPFVIKPAMKEHFVYATKVKAWRADTHAELRSFFLKASELVPPGEVMIQELIPGGGSQQFAYCAFFREGEAIGSMVARRRRQHPTRVWQSQYVCRDCRHPYSRRLLPSISLRGKLLWPRRA